MNERLILNLNDVKRARRPVIRVGGIQIDVSTPKTKKPYSTNIFLKNRGKVREVTDELGNVVTEHWNDDQDVRIIVPEAVRIRWGMTQ